MRGGWVERGTVMIRLGRAHFAFYRGYLDGLDVGDLAARYLTAELPSSRTDARPDLRLAKSAVSWIRGQLLVLARRSLAPADVRLLALAPAVLLVEYGRAAPSLDAFREEHDADGMYGETELIALYEQAHGTRSAVAERRAARNGRLRQRQQQALNRLEAVTRHDPQPADRVDGWLDPVLASRLHAVGVDLLADLVALIDRHGYRWYRKVPRIGIKAALQIGHWLQDEAVRAIPGLQPAGRPYQPPRTVTAAAPAVAVTAIVALEHFCMPPPARLPPAGDASDDEGTAVLAPPEAEDDVAAIRRWLALKPANGHTWRAYRKEAERLLLWTVLERGKTLGTLNADDLSAYRDFLALIGTVTPGQWHVRFRLPQDRWIGTPGTARTSRFWRPFNGPLGMPSQRQAATILKGMLGWLTEQGHLQANPLLLPTALTSRMPRAPARALQKAEWQAVRTHLERQPPGWARDRLRCLLALAAGAGLRLSELAMLRRAHAHAIESSDDKAITWTLQWHDAAGVARIVALSPAVMAEIDNWFRRRGFAEFAAAPADSPILAALPGAPRVGRPGGAHTRGGSTNHTEAALGADRIHRIVKRLFEEAARECLATEPALAGRLRAASAHWLRQAASDGFTLATSATSASHNTFKA